MIFRTRRYLVIASLLLAAACASGGKGSGATAPKLIGDDYPSLMTSGRPEPVRVALTVMIDANGTADLTTLRIAGTENTEQRAAVVDWLGRSRFKPAELHGQPIRAEYTMDLRTKIVTRTERR